MTEAYYILEMRYGNRFRRYHIWCDIDGVNTLLCRDGKIAGFDSKQELQDYCKEVGLSLIDEGNEIYIPEMKAAEALLKKNTEQFCKILLNEWNLTQDINKTFERRNPYLDGCNRLYDKIFRGNNLEVFRTDKEPLYVPHFSKREQKLLRRIISEIYSVFEETLLQPE